MRYLKRYKIFESSERNKDISSLLGNNQGYYNLFDKFHKGGISIERLSELINRIREDRNLIKINLTTLETIEQIDDYLTKVEEESKYNKVLDQLSNRYNNLLSDKVKSLLYDNRDDIELLKMFFRKIKVYKDSSQFYTALDNFIKNNKGDFNLKSILPKISETSQIIHKDESLLIVKINTFEQSKLLGSQNWCISRQEHYFNSYSNNRRQYFIWDFTMPSHSKLSQIGVTLELSGKYHTAHYKDDSQCSADYVADNFGDYLEMHKWIYNEMLLGNMINEISIKSVFTKITKEEKEKLVNNKKFMMKSILNPSIFELIYNTVPLDFESVLNSLDDDFKKINTYRILNILSFLLSKGVNISKMIPLVYLEVGGFASKMIISQALIEYNFTDLNITSTDVSKSDIDMYSLDVQDKLLDILIKKGAIKHYILRSVNKQKYDEIAEEYKDKNFLEVPVNCMPFISTKSIIRDFNFELTKDLHSRGNKNVLEAIARLYNSMEHEVDILEMFKSKCKSDYDIQMKNLYQFDDLKLVDGNYVYNVSDEVVQYFSKKEVYTRTPKHHIIDKGDVLRYLAKEYYINDTFEEDIQNFYKKEFEDMSAIEMIRSEFYINRDFDIPTIDISSRYWPTGIGFDAPLNEFYEAWEKAKKQYLENLSFDLWIGFSSAFYNHFGFKNNSDEPSFHTRNLIVNPFKIWVIKKLWSIGPDSSEFSDYIMDYCRSRNFYFIEWKDMVMGESFHYYLSQELRVVCSKYNKDKHWKR